MSKASFSLWKLRLIEQQFFALSNLLLKLTTFPPLTASDVSIFHVCVLLLHPLTSDLMKKGLLIPCIPGHTTVDPVHDCSRCVRCAADLSISQWGLHVWKVLCVSWVLGCGLMWWTGPLRPEEAAQHEKCPSQQDFGGKNAVESQIFFFFQMLCLVSMVIYLVPRISVRIYWLFFCFINKCINNQSKKGFS